MQEPIERPTEPGWYWVNAGLRNTIVHIKRQDGMLKWGASLSPGMTIYVPIPTEPLKWWGPLEEPPEESKEPND